MPAAARLYLARYTLEIFAGVCHQADAGFVAGALPRIEYALPINLYLRGVLTRVANLLDQHG